MLTLALNVEQGEAVRLRGERKRSSRKGKSLRDFFPDVRLMRCHADRACCLRALCRHSKGDLPWHREPIGEVWNSIRSTLPPMVIKWRKCPGSTSLGCGASAGQITPGSGRHATQMSEGFHWRLTPLIARKSRHICWDMASTRRTYHKQKRWIKSPQCWASALWKVKRLGWKDKLMLLARVQ